VKNQKNSSTWRKIYFFSPPGVKFIYFTPPSVKYIFFTPSEASRFHKADSATRRIPQSGFRQAADSVADSAADGGFSSGFRGGFRGGFRQAGADSAIPQSGLGKKGPFWTILDHQGPFWTIEFSHPLEMKRRK
jgi:hypothetical protein